MVRVSNPDDPTKTSEIPALLDTGSNRTFCSEEVFQDLGINTSREQLRISTLGAKDSLTPTRAGSLLVSGLDGKQAPLHMERVYSMPRPHIGPLEIATTKDVEHLPHLKDIPLHAKSPVEVKLLVGVDNHRALIPQAVAVGKEGEPYAVRSRLGWTLLGPVPTAHYHGCFNIVGEETDELSRRVDRFWAVDSSGLFDNARGQSQSDRKIELLWKTGIVTQGRHYTLPIPFKNDEPHLPDNWEMARKRLDSLGRRLRSDDGLKKQYTSAMQDLLDQGYAEPADSQGKPGSAWYIPHHPVISTNKAKIRIVFDCAAKTRGISLNDVVHQGPDYINSLVGVLVRFRLRRVAFMADVQAMFHQVRVPEDQRDYLRFLWWPEGNMDDEPRVYRMTAHLFGGTWSPSACGFALRQTATDLEEEYGREAAYTIRNNFYVDDCLKSVDTPAEGIRLIHNLKRMLYERGFRLTKWTSNCRAVLREIPHEDRSRSQKERVAGTPLEEQALGVHWSVHRDVLAFGVQPPLRPRTKRGILSALSSIYDPLGLVSPFVLGARLIVQDLCREKVGWDEPLSSQVQARWDQWKEDLNVLPQLRFPRCLQPPWSTSHAVAQLHHFADASQIAYGVASYLRICERNRVWTTLVMAKSRLAPLKEMTIPRLELSAATLATRQDELLRRELDIELSPSQFWTDSTIVLQYIRNEDRRFHVFVANRVAEIRARSSPTQWHHVPTSDNPADDCSRGTKPLELKGERWMRGPAFLQEPPDKWPRIDEVLAIPKDDPEVKGEVTSLAVEAEEPDFLDTMMNYHSDFSQLLRRLALMTALFERSALVMTLPLRARMEDIIWKRLQLQHFPEEIRALKKGKALPSGSPLLRLNPTLDDGLLVATGRLKQAAVGDGRGDPTILPGKHQTVESMMRWIHAINGHCGAQQLIAESRRNYWVLGAAVLARRIVNKCWVCRKRDARPLGQRMADLPPDRVEAGVAAFTHVGLDYFGPFFVKHRRNREKRYGCLFTCLKTRAVHVEVAHTLDADSFMSALYRFFARRGMPAVIRSDNGKNLIAGERELRGILRSWNQQRITEGLAERSVKWIFNPPDASHMGGVWERQIRTIRRMLAGLVQEQVLTDEALRTLMTIAEGIVNNRPLTAASDDPKDLEVLTPNHLLILKTASLPGRDFGPETHYVRQRWKQVLLLANTFWTRWIQSYLPSLRARTKWHRQQRNVQVGDVVLVVDKMLNREHWPLARVVKTFSRYDGLVRSVEVRTATGVFKRPIHRLCLLEASS